MSPTRKVVRVPRKKKRQIKALSVQQPWANLIASGEKTIEVRKKPTRHRGPLLICASKRPPVPPFGRMVALVDVVNCWPLKQADERAAQVKRERGDKRFAWVSGECPARAESPSDRKPGVFQLRPTTRRREAARRQVAESRTLTTSPSRGAPGKAAPTLPKP